MSTFQFKHFSVSQSNSTMKVGTDAMLLGSLIQANKPQTILDIGTGTGVIALMMAQRYSDAQITGLEIDNSASEEAQENFKQSKWSDRMNAMNGDVLEYQFNQKFDLIVSNPPYYENSLISENKRISRAKHAEFLPANVLMSRVSELLSEEGTFWVIVPSENTHSWIENARLNDLYLNESVSIIGKEGQGEKRSVLAFSSKEIARTSSSLIVRDSKGKYTKDYIELTKEFHDRDLSEAK